MKEITNKVTTNEKDSKNYQLGDYASIVCIITFIGTILCLVSNILYQVDCQKEYNIPYYYFSYDLLYVIFIPGMILLLYILPLIYIKVNKLISYIFFTIMGLLVSFLIAIIIYNNMYIKVAFMKNLMLMIFIEVTLLIISLITAVKNIKAKI